jgi:putative membrane protein
LLSIRIYRTRMRRRARHGTGIAFSFRHRDKSIGGACHHMLKGEFQMSTKQKNLQALLGTAAFAVMFGAASVHAAGNAGGSSAASGTTNSSAGSGSQTSGASASGSKSSKSSVGDMSQADEKMMKELAITNMAEIQAAQIALDKSKDDQVQKFAQKMLDDHTKAHEKVRDLAQIKNVALPKELDGKHQAEIKKLSSLDGDKFDKTYLQRGGVSDHKQAMQLLERIEKRAKDPQLQAMATDLKPTISEHRQMAMQLVKGNAAATSGSSGATTGGTSSGSSSGSASGTGQSSQQPGGSGSSGEKGSGK